MTLHDSATRDIESVALKFAGELNAIAEDLANKAHSGIDGAEVYEAILAAWEGLGTLHEEYSAEIDTLYQRHLRFGA